MPLIANVEMSQISIDRSQRLGKRKGPGQKPPTIISKFIQCKDRHHVFRNEKLLSHISSYP